MSTIDIVKQFKVKDIAKVKPLRGGLINNTYLVYVNKLDTPQYILQRINNYVFKDVPFDMLAQKMRACKTNLEFQVAFCYAE